MDRAGVKEYEVSDIGHTENPGEDAGEAGEDRHGDKQQGGHPPPREGLLLHCGHMILNLRRNSFMYFYFVFVQ